jgi:vacuolar-type H+-ATPase subunit H
MSYTTVTHCGNDHLEWLKSIDFYEDEFDTLEKRLMEIADKNSGHEVMAGVEHFQNQFIVQRNNIDELRHSINEHAGKVSADAKAHAGKMETYLIGEHDRVKDQFNIFEKIVKELRHEFNLFLAKWM